MPDTGFIKAVQDALRDRLPRLLFSESQLAAMKAPGHPGDHYELRTPLSGKEPWYSKFQLVRPTVIIHDPRVTDAQVASLPRNLTVEHAGSTYTAPLTISTPYPHGADADRWLAELERLHESRIAIMPLAAGIAGAFELGAGKVSVDCDRSDVFTVNIEQPAGVRSFNNEARVESYAASWLTSVLPGRKPKVKVVVGEALTGPL